MTSVKKFKVPNYDEDPGDEMVNWVNECSIDWDGDESGIIFWKKVDGVDYFLEAVPNDFVCGDDETKEYWVETPDGIRKLWQAQD